MHRIRQHATILFIVLALLGLQSCGNKDGADTVDAAPIGAKGPIPFAELDFTTLPEDFPEAIKVVRASQGWSRHKKHLKDKGDRTSDPRDNLKLKMSREVLEETYDLGQDFLVNWQLEKGNFRYMYDWIEGTWVKDDHQVRQAGSLWGIGTSYRYRPSDKAKASLDLGLKFWFENTIDGPGENTLTLKYPGARRVDSGTVALVSLAIIEYLKADAPMEKEWRTELETKLAGYLAFLQWMQLDNGHISKAFDHRKNQRQERYSPYYDGESLLAMTKAARQLGHTDLVPTIEKAARAMAETYTVGAWPEDIDSNDTKGFFQWGCMSFVEYYQGKWKDYELFGDVAISLGWWMAHTHATLKRRRNHAYAVEGLIAAWQVANLRGDVDAQNDLLFTLDRSLYKLSSWQIGGPLAKNNKFLIKKAQEAPSRGASDPMALGGVMNARKPSGRPVKKDVAHQLRIDVTQHQMHAVTMSLEEVYRPLPKK